MHSYLQGVGGWIFANAIYELVDAGAFGTHAGEWKVRIQKGLDCAYKTFLTDCHTQGVEH